jgi:hypothetical protein
MLDFVLNPLEVSNVRHTQTTGLVAVPVCRLLQLPTHGASGVLTSS